MNCKERVLIEDEYFKAVHKISINPQGEEVEEWCLTFFKNHKDTINKLLQLYQGSSN